MKPKAEVTGVTPSKSGSIWSLELLLVVGLPFVAVVACAITLLLALNSPAHESVRVDRFGHVVQAGH